MDLWFHRVERPSRSVPREKREPQAGPASCLSNSASKERNASGDGVSLPEPNTETPADGEGVEGLPGSKSVARAEADARNRGGPESPCRTNYEGQAGRAAQRQEAPSGTPGVGSAHSIQWQGASPETGEGADVLAKHTQATRAVRMTDPTGKPSCERRRRASAKSPVRYVVNFIMWCRAGRSRHSLGFPPPAHHIISCIYTVLRKLIRPFSLDCLLADCTSGASQRAKALAFIFRSLSA